MFYNYTCNRKTEIFITDISFDILNVGFEWLVEKVFLQGKGNLLGKMWTDFEIIRFIIFKKVILKYSFKMAFLFIITLY